MIDCVCLSLCCSRLQGLINDVEFKKADKMHRGVFLGNLAKLINIGQVPIKYIDSVAENTAYVSLIYGGDKDPAIHSVFHFQICYKDNKDNLYFFEERPLSGGSPFSNHGRSPFSLPNVET